MIVFVAGVHGVGKTHLCQALATKTGLRHATASQLIREATQSVSWKNDKVVTDIESNQDALIVAVDEIMQHEDVLILDGHFVLKKGSRRI
ncbi:AAA family ATPase [Pseudomonas sp. S32]|uniref:AAA family ATPase n=1 Tax=Pseudomonas sp. S32 TaxID=2767448 RepID=UPI0019126DF7|nr:AAA family ATPase [Pseudomonas sp. S32]MBK5007366.1 AAA family ATPase [Pseudomonas sp. S32]